MIVKRVHNDFVLIQDEHSEEKLRKRKSTKNMVRKMTTESRIADKHQRREICLKNLRECAINITKGNSINQIDTILRDQVRCVSIL